MLKYVSMLLLAYVFSEIIGNGLTGFNFLFMSTKDLNNLKEKIISDKFIPANYDVNDIVTDEIMLTSWDINSRTPRFFTKWSK